MKLASPILLLLAVFLSVSCESTLPSPIEELQELNFIASYPLDISDPSGLTLDVGGEYLWTVSDDPGGHIYKISFTGEILEVLTAYEGDDMEGITMNPNDKTLWVAEEKLRQIVQLTTEGEVLQVVDVPVDSTNLNDGLEGIAWNPANDHVFILNEKNPKLFIELDSEFNLLRSLPVRFDAPFEMDDLAGLFYLQEEGEFWIVSDDSEKIVVTDVNLNPLRGYKLDADKYEGIAVDKEAGRLYLVNDRKEELFVFELPE